VNLSRHKPLCSIADADEQRTHVVDAGRDA
jgi:hypothetical protein